MEEGGRGMGSGEVELGGENEGAGCSSCLKNRDERKERDTLKEGAIMGLARETSQ